MCSGAFPSARFSLLRSVRLYGTLDDPRKISNAGLEVLFGLQQEYNHAISIHILGNSHDHPTVRVIVKANDLQTL